MKNTQGVSSLSGRDRDGLPRGYYWFFIIMMAGMSAFGSFVNDMYVPSLPLMTHFFHASASTVQLGLSFGMLGLASGQIVLGPVSDKTGRIPVLKWTLLLFIISCLASIFSPNIGFFLGCRFFQGVGASCGYFLGRTMPADVTGGRSLAQMMAVIGAINGIAPASAPVLGGVLADGFGWQGTFVFLALFGLLLFVASHWLKESLPAGHRSQGSIWHAFDNYKALICQLKFMTHVMLKGVTLGLLFAYISSAPFILQNHYGVSQSMFGLIMGCNALFVVAGSMIALKFRYLKTSALTGGIIVLAGMIGEAVSLYLIHNFWVYEAWMVTSIFGMGLIFTASNTLAMNEGRQDAGSASALLGVAGYLFGMVASPIVGLGDILHTTAVTFVILGIAVLGISVL